MVTSISNLIHQKLKKFLMTNNKPIGLIVDTSNDYYKNHYLSVLIQTLENNRPNVYLYRLIKLGKDESAKGMADLLKDNIQKDGLLGVFASNLRAFSSDGAHSMTGVKNGLIAYVRKYLTNKKVIANHCAGKN